MLYRNFRTKPRAKSRPPSGAPLAVAKAEPLTAAEAEARRHFMDAVGRLQRSVGTSDVFTALGGHDAARAVDALDWQGWGDALDAMKAQLADVAQSAAHDAVLGIDHGLLVSFGGDMAKAGERAAAGVGDHIVGIDRRTREAVKTIIGDGLRDGTSIPDLTRQVSNVVGLLPSQAKTLDRYEKSLLEAGVTPGNVRLQSIGLRDRMLSQRSEGIARYETMWASNQGRLDGYDYAQAMGAIGADAKKQWVVADGCCDECDDVADEEVPLDEDFSVGVDAPPLHVNCRCTTVISNEGTVDGALVAPEMVGDDVDMIDTTTDDGYAAQAATDILDNARAAEPEVSDAMTVLADENGAQLEGFDHRLKGEDSLARKIASDAVEKGITQQQAAAEISDALRYTMTFPADDYTGSVERVAEDLQSRGFTFVKERNTWDPPASPYRGLNTNLTSPDGFRFELQFHTPESFELKSGVNHTAYEKWRVLDPDSAEARALWDEMATHSVRLPEPAGASTIRLI